MERKYLERQLRRQATWLRESWLYHIAQKILFAYDSALPTALDVGCGPGFVMEQLKGSLDPLGVDKDPDMVEACRAKGFEAHVAMAEDLPFEDREFDVVYCSFLLLWVKDPLKVVREMRRVSRRWVLCLAEPDYGSRIDHPESMKGLKGILADGIRAQGGDPEIGRKLRSIFNEGGLDCEMGVHAGVWDIQRLGQEFDDEWRFVQDFSDGRVPDDELKAIKEAWKIGLEDGSLFQYNPIFFAFGKR